MKKFLLFASIVFCLSVTVAGQGIRFEKGSFEEVLAKAKKENKLVFVDAYAVWCGPCKWMAENVFKEKKVGEFFDQHLLAFKIDVERGEGPSLQSRYAIEGLPGYLFLDPEGNVVFRGSGSMPTQAFMDMVRQALEVLKDPNSVVRMSANYPQKKSDEVFVREYLDKLKASKSTGYYDVVEQYLKIQKSMSPESRDMVMFLYDHAKSLVFGGEADRIIQENFGSASWDEYAWKEIRECFQKLPDGMLRQTVEYAIVKKDSLLLRVAYTRGMESGLDLPDGYWEQMLLHYYQQVGNGNAYRKLAKPQVEAYYNSLDVAELKAGHQRVEEAKREDPGRMRISYAELRGDELRGKIAEYARYAVAAEDGADISRWAYRVYELIPNRVENICFYAKALYLYGDKEEALKLMEEGIRLGEDNKNIEGFRKDLKLMQAGEAVHLTF